MSELQHANEIVIEVASELNNTLLFGPLGNMEVRGRWDFNHVAGRFTHDSMKALNKATSVIPGECLAVDPKARTCRLFDPLRETPQGRKIWQAIKPIIERYASHFECGTSLREPIVYTDCDEDRMKTWLYYMRRAVDSGLAVVVGNRELPTLEEIKALPGRRECGFGANTQYATDEEREKARWKDIVPLTRRATPQPKPEA
jgi:hypothetical protein